MTTKARSNIAGPRKHAPLALFMTVAGLSAASPALGGGLPPDSKPLGASYAEWAASRGEWALSNPQAAYTDNTGEHCADGQSGPVWYLAGRSAFGAVRKQCTIGVGTPILFSPINYTYCAYASDPAPQRTIEYVLDAVAAIHIENATASVTVDGESVPAVLVTSTPFGSDDVPGAQPADLPYYPCVAAGWYVMLSPLPPGDHVIHYVGDYPGTPVHYDVTYVIHVSQR